MKSLRFQVTFTIHNQTWILEMNYTTTSQTWQMTQFQIIRNIFHVFIDLCFTLVLLHYLF